VIDGRQNCPLCSPEGEDVVWADGRCRIIHVDDANFPGYCRVIWNAHQVEMTDLAPKDRDRLMAVVSEVEVAIRETTGADKINLASFGNVVPHLHWHVIPRWRDDAFFPNPIWGERLRESVRRPFDKAALRGNICKRLEAGAAKSVG